MEQRDETSRWRWAGGVTLVLATVVVYYNSLEIPFVFDDGPAIERNTTIRRLWPLSEVLSPPADGAGVTGRPLVNLSLALNYAAGGLAARGYHATNLALHVLAALTLWGILRRTLRACLFSAGAHLPPRWRVVPPPPGGSYSDPLLRGGGRSRERWDVFRAEFVAFGTALLWAVHPLQTESVVCVVQRSEVLGGLFLLLTLYGFIRATGTDAGPSSPAMTAWRRIWPVVTVTSCLLGVASKEIVATAPLLVLLYDRTFVAGSFRRAWRDRWRLHVALATTWVPLAWLMAGSQNRAGTVGLGLGVSSWDYLLTQCRALVLYLKLSLWPHPLVVDYGMGLVTRIGDVWWQGLLVMTLLGGTVWALWRRPLVGFAGAWFFVILAPSSSFVPLITQTIAEHRMYLPLAAVLVLVVLGLYRIAGHRGVVGWLALIAGGGWLTVARNEIYRDEHLLWRDVLARQPGNARAHVNLGYYAARQEDWPRAIEHNREALRLLPDYADAYNGLGQALEQVGRKAEALAAFARAQELMPDDPQINFNYGSELARAGRLEEGIARLEAALRVKPDHANARNNLGLALTQLGRMMEAEEHYRAGLRADPDHAELRGNLANAYLASGKFSAAVAEYEHVLRAHPDFAGVRQNLAVTLTRMGRPAEAITHFEQAIVQLSDSPQLHHLFAVALAQAGRTAEAIVHEETALRLKPDYITAREHLATLRSR